VPLASDSGADFGVRTYDAVSTVKTDTGPRSEQRLEIDEEPVASVLFEVRVSTVKPSTIGAVPAKEHERPRTPTGMRNPSKEVFGSVHQLEARPLVAQDEELVVVENPGIDEFPHLKVADIVGGLAADLAGREVGEGMEGGSHGAS